MKQVAMKIPTPLLISDRDMTNMTSMTGLFGKYGGRTSAVVYP